MNFQVFDHGHGLSLLRFIRDVYPAIRAIFSVLVFCPFYTDFCALPGVHGNAAGYRIAMRVIFLHLGTIDLSTALQQINLDFLAYFNILFDEQSVKCRYFLVQLPRHPPLLHLYLYLPWIKYCASYKIKERELIKIDGRLFNRIFYLLLIKG